MSNSISISLEAGASTTTDKSTLPSTYNDLNPRQKQRVDYMQGLIGDKAFELVINLEGRGRNSFESVYNKVTALLNARHEGQRYFDTLYENIDLNKVYTVTHIIGIVAEVRKDLKLPPYLTSPKTHCLNDLFNLFLVKDEVIASPKRQLVGYRPMVRIKPDLD